MDEKKAIDCLKNIIEYRTHKPTEVEAAKLAIGALEKQLADRWIPVSEGLPEEYGTYLVAWRPLRQNADDVKANTDSNLTHYYEILEFDPDDEAKWLESIEQSYGEYTVIAWKPLPEPYQSLKKEKYIDEFEEQCPCMSEESLNCGMKCSRCGREL